MLSIRLIPLLGLAAALMTTGCAELQSLRERTQTQESLIANLRKENAEFRDAYYKIKETLDSELAKSGQNIDQLQRELEQAKNLKTQEEKRLSDELRTCRLETEALQKEMEDQRMIAEAAQAQLTRNLQTAQAERDAALAKVTELDASLRTEQARAQELTEQLAAEKVELQRQQETVARLQGEAEQAKQALTQKTTQAEQAQAQIAEIQGKLDQANQQLQDSQAQLSQASGELDTLKSANQNIAKLEQEKSELAAQVAKLQSNAKPRLDQDSTLATLRDQLTQKLSQTTGTAPCELTLDASGLHLIFSSDQLFEKNSIVLSGQAAALLAPAVELVKQAAGRAVRVEGHTDNQPIQDLPFADNWGLGFARADRVREFLMKQGVGGGSLSAVSHSYFTPRGDLSTAEGRAKSRRVEIVIGEKK